MSTEPFHAAGEGPPLVLLHGLTASWRIWQPILPALAEHHAVFAPTQAAHHGGPALEPANGGVPAFADAIERLLDERGIGTAHLVGNSLGGWVALELAGRGRARSVVCLSPAGGWRSDRDLDRLVRMFTMLDRTLEPRRDLVVGLLRRPRSRRLVLRTTLEHGERVPAGAAVEMIDDAIGSSAVAGMVEWVRTATSVEPDLPDDLPVRIAWGEKDRTLPFKAYGRPIADALPHAEQVTLPGCGHVPMYDDPDAVVRTILEVTTKEPVPCP